MAKEKERLYFIIRAWLMAQIGAIFFLAVVWVLGTIDFVQTITLGVFVFIISLSISRFFDSQINKGVRKILKFLDRHKKTKKFILKYF